MQGILEAVRPALGERYDEPALLGEGGMSVVFRAVDRKHDRAVAIKVLRPELAIALGAERFLTEIRICAQLSHPHILPLYDSGSAGSLLYYIMPLVDGESLRARLSREGALAIEDALHIARGVAAALDYAHGRGIVHRDIKPENVMLCAGEPIVADFGVAKAISSAEKTRHTSPGFAVGTPVYMSPEQACGEPDLDGRSDIYSLGCVLYEMLTGTVPFDGETAMAITAAKLSDAPPPVAARRPVAAALEAVVARALAPQPAQRFATARELARALAGGAYPLATFEAPTDPAPEAVPQAPLASVAVLPFVNQGGEEDDEFFSDGLTEDLIHLLGSVEGLHVVARTTAYAFKDTSEDVRAIGRRLNIGAVLEGSVRRAGNRLRVTTRLIKTADGYQLWSERFDRTLDDVFAVQDEIAQATVRALESRLLGRSAASAARNREAHELYLRGRRAWNLRTEEGLKASVEYLKSAIGVDPNYALAHAALADSYATLGVYGVQAAHEVMPLAEHAAERALQIEPDLAEALTALGCVKACYRWEWNQAEALFRRAIAARPGYATAHQWLAMNVLAPGRRFAEARAALADALRYDPLNPSIRVSQGLVEHFAGDSAAAVETYRRAIEADPGFGMARYFLGRALSAMGRHAEAVAAFGRAAELAGSSPDLAGALGYSLARLARREAALEKLAELEARSRERYVSPVLTALVAIGLGDRERALADLERAADQRSIQLIWVALRPSFAVLRDEPRFRAVLERTGLVAG